MRAGIASPRSRALVACLVTAALAAIPSSASQVRPVPLEEMAQRAARIFSGRCTHSRVSLDQASGRAVTEATFRVDRAVKGVTGKSVTIRMMDAEAGAGGQDGGRGRAPAFRSGEDVVLFLYGESAMGFSSPVGMGQGHFEIFTDKQGRRRALNSLGNSRLLTDLRPEARARLTARERGPGGTKDAGPGSDLDPEGLLDAAAWIVSAGPRR